MPRHLRNLLVRLQQFQMILDATDTLASIDVDDFDHDAF